jgi:uncharacterized membrane protein YoaK (UPF0700 family)
MIAQASSPRAPSSLRLGRALQAIVPDGQDRDGPLPALLLGLTLVTGLVDAFSYLALGHVFVANMTGNVVFLAFALAGAPGFSIAASLLALTAFVVGAAVGGRVARASGADRARLLRRTVTVEAILFGAAAAVTAVSDPGTGSVQDLLIVVLALTMGMQNATARRVAVPDLTTTVLTLTITGIAADGRLGAGSNGHVGRRTLAVAAMFIGALIGSALVLWGSAALALLLALLVTAAITAVLGLVSSSTRSTASAV